MEKRKLSNEEIAKEIRRLADRFEKGEKIGLIYSVDDGEKTEAGSLGGWTINSAIGVSSILEQIKQAMFSQLSELLGENMPESVKNKIKEASNEAFKQTLKEASKDVVKKASKRIDVV
jgi:hypothetical protein